MPPNGCNSGSTVLRKAEDLLLGAFWSSSFWIVGTFSLHFSFDQIAYLNSISYSWWYIWVVVLFILGDNPI